MTVPTAPTDITVPEYAEVTRHVPELGNVRVSKNFLDGFLVLNLEEPIVWRGINYDRSAMVMRYNPETGTYEATQVYAYRDHMKGVVSDAALAAIRDRILTVVNANVAVWHELDEWLRVADQARTAMNRAKSATERRQELEQQLRAAIEKEISAEQRRIAAVTAYAEHVTAHGEPA